MEKKYDFNYQAYLAEKAREEYEEEGENLEIEEEYFPHKFKMRVEDPNLKAYLAEKAREEYEEEEE